MKTTKIIATGRIWELLHYNPSTGIFRWKKSTSNRAKNGSIAGYINSQGYVFIQLDGKMWLGHRLAWQYINGTTPDGVGIDHINCDKADNRISNLRLANKSQNGANSRKSKRGAGLKGVTYNSQEGKYVAKLMAKGRYYHLGRFDTPEEAHAAYLAAAQKHFGEFARAA